MCWCEDVDIGLCGFVMVVVFVMCMGLLVGVVIGICCWVGMMCVL